MNKGIKLALLAAELAAIGAWVWSPALSYGFTVYGVRVAIGVVFALLLLLALRREEMQRVLGKARAAAAIGLIGRVDALELAVCCIPAALIGARLAYCLVRFSFYFMEMGPLSVVRIWEGGFLLWGAALGAMGAAAALARKRHASIPATLDELAAPGLLAIAVARLGERVTGEGVGAWIENEALMRFPIAIMNEYEEWQLAVFLFEAAAALLLLWPVLKKRVGEGERIMTALLGYSCCQVVLESLRMDSCLKIGFVRVSQVACGVAILAVTALRAHRRGARSCMIKRSALVALGVAVIGGLEWALDKTPVDNLLIYGVMSCVCAGLYLNAATLKRKG